MERDTHVVALCGSRRDESRTRVALRAALDAAADTGATTELVDLREYDLPPLDPDAPTPADAEALSDTVADADAVLIGTPNYHGSYAGHLKNALDHLGRDEFGGKLVGLLEIAGGSYPKALAHLRAVCRTLNAWTHPLEVAIPNASSTVGLDGIDDGAVRDRVRELGRELAEYAGVEAYPELAARQSDRAESLAGAPGE
jgi:NAD(P)H-dependent FMN reductase